MIAGMAQATILIRRAASNPAELARMLIVCGCAVALIAAGAALPF